MYARCTRCRQSWCTGSFQGRASFPRPHLSRPQSDMCHSYRSLTRLLFHPVSSRGTRVPHQCIRSTKCCQGCCSTTQHHSVPPATESTDHPCCLCTAGSHNLCSGVSRRTLQSTRLKTTHCHNSFLQQSCRCNTFRRECHRVYQHMRVAL